MDMEDLDDIIEIENESFNKPYDRDDFMEIFEKNSQTYCYVVLVDEKMVAGYIMFEEGEKGCHVVSIAVRKDYRGLHLGEYMMRFLIDTTKCENIYLNVLHNNIAAQKLYSKLGFQSQDWNVGYYRGEGDGLFMSLKKQK